MNPITQALGSGYNHQQILGYLLNAYPHLKNKINKAVNAGYPPEQIIDFLSGMINTNRPYQPAPRGSTQQSIGARKKREDELKQQQLLKTALSLAGGVAAGSAARNVLPAVGSLLGRGQPPQTPAQTAQAPVAQAMGAPPAQAGQAPAPPGLNAQNLLNQMGIAPRIQNLLNAGNPAKVVSSAVKSMLTPGQKTWLKTQTDQPIEEIVNEYMQQAQPEEKPEKMALLPSGEIGKVVDERQGIATLETESGKTRTRPLDELIQEPEDAAVTALELIKSFTPEEQRSAHHAVSFYDTDENKAYFLFHSGDAYRVDEVTPDEYQKLSHEIVGAKTTGSTMRGEWSAGGGSRGAAYHQIVKLSNKPYKKLQVGYDIFREFQKRLNEAEKRKKRKRS
jgi:hypothetical protein